LFETQLEQRINHPTANPPRGLLPKAKMPNGRVRIYFDN
jgi:hypothetical protein